MNETFAVGEIAIIQGLIYWPEYNGQECEVIEGVQFVRGRDPRSGVISECYRYRVRTSDGATHRIIPPNLRKKKPKEHPREQTTTWDELRKIVNWKPEGVRV